MVKSSNVDIRALRKAAGHTQASLARLFAVTKRTIARWEHGQANVHPIYVLRLQEMAIDRQREAPVAEEA